jgi:ATP-dependent helicase/DNAse subunit B
MSGFFTKTHEQYPDTDLDHVAEKFVGQLKSVSFSTLTNFESCQYQVFLDKVGKVGRAAAPAADRGSELHELLENYVLGTTKKVAWSKFKSGDFHQPMIDRFRKLYQDGVIEPDMWLRGAVDLVHRPTPDHAILYDYKSGSTSSSAKHRAQLMLYAMMMYFAYPELERIDVAAVYLDHKQSPFYTTYTRADVPNFWPRFQLRLQAVTSCTEFKPNPNGFSCRFCQHKKTQDELDQTEPACKFAFTG